VSILGDLSKPLLGLTQNKFNELAQNIDVIIHNAAYVHWLQPYEKLHATNVLGTKEVIRLASKSKLKPIHHVSTTSVFDTSYHTKLKVVYEDDPLSSCENLSGGYPQTKWVAEKLMMYGRARGIPVSIYRPGYITGDSIRGVWNVDDFLCRLIKGCIQLGAAPILVGATLDMSSVDYVAKMIIKLTMTQTQSNKAYHIINPNLYSFDKMFSSIQAFGYKVQQMNYIEWRSKLVASVNQSTDGMNNALSTILSHFTDEWPEQLANKPKYDYTHIKEMNIECPMIDSILGLYFSYFIQCGFVKPPPTDANNNLQINWKIIGEGVQILTRSNRSL